MKHCKRVSLTNMTCILNNAITRVLLVHLDFLIKIDYTQIVTDFSCI